MALPKRFTMAATLVAAVAMLAHAAAPHPSVDQRKRDVIRDGLARLQHASPDWVVLQATARAAALSSIAIDATPEQTVLRLTLDRHVLANCAYPNASRLVLDLHQAIPVMPRNASAPHGGLVKKTTTSLQAMEPQFVTRMTFDLAEPVTVAFQATEIGLNVILTAAPPTTTPDQQISAQIDRDLAREQAQLTIRRDALREMQERLDSTHYEHTRFLTQALLDLEGLLRECKIAQVRRRLDTAISDATLSDAEKNWQAQVADLGLFIAEVKAAQTAMAEKIQKTGDTSLRELLVLTLNAQNQSERFALQSVTASADNSLLNLRDAIEQARSDHAAIYDALIADCSRLTVDINDQLASLRDHALARQEEARHLLQQLQTEPPASPRVAAALTSSIHAMNALFGTASGIQAVGDLHPDLSHAPQLVAALDEAQAAPADPSQPPGKRKSPTVTTEAAQPVQDNAKIESRMGTIFPEITTHDAPVVLPGVAMLGAVEQAPVLDTLEPARNYSGDPLDQLVNIDFREMELSHVVSILAKKAQINVIAGTDVTGTVTANLRNVPLRQAMETALRMNGLGMIEEDGIYRIVTYEEAVAARRATRMLYLNNSQADEVKKTLDEVLEGSPDAALMSISANASTNVIILSGPAATVDEFEQMVRNLDVAEPTLPTATRAFRLNYAEPSDITKIVQSVLSADVGQVAIDTRSRQIIVTDIPIVIEQVAQLIEEIDLPVKQVAIEAMVVDAVMTDSAQTGVEWMAEAIRRTSRRGDPVSELSELALDTDLGIGEDAVALLTFGILSSDVNIQATIAAEVSHGNAQLLTNPQVVTIENQLAKISISQEIPYREIRQSEAGGTQTTTSFKEVGTVLEVMPRVTHEDDVIVKIDVKQSDTKGEFEGIPIEDKREAGTTLRAKDGQTIFIGGLRKYDDTQNVRKIPFLGDIPVANFLFRSNVNRTEINELLIFLTCHVLQEHVPDLTPYQQMKYDELGGTALVPTTERDVMGNIAHPSRVREPFWKWRRQK